MRLIDCIHPRRRRVKTVRPCDPFKAALDLAARRRMGNAR